MECSVLEMFSDRSSAPTLLGCRPSARKSLGRSQKRFQLLTKSSFCSLHHDDNHSFKANSLLNLSLPRRYVGSGPDTMIVAAGVVLRTVSIRLLKSLFSVSVCRSLVSLTPACSTTAPMLSSPFRIADICAETSRTRAPGKHIVMTACSTALGLGLMPLLLYLYSQGFSSLAQSVPFTGIIIALIMILVPCGIGILINYRVPQYSKIITQVGLALLMVSCVVIGVLAGIADGGKIFTVLSPQLIATAALMPLTGFICGYILSTLFCMNEPCRRTISMEVGCQNIQLCTTILKVAFSSELIGQLYFFPVIYIVFQKHKRTQQWKEQLK